VHIHENVMIPVCVKTHIWPSYSKSESWPIGSREQQSSWVKAAVQAIHTINWTEFLSLVNECEHKDWVYCVNCVSTMAKKFVGDQRQLSECLCSVYLLPHVCMNINCDWKS